MIFYTGDIHGDASRVVQFAQHYTLRAEDTIVILGDVGANYYGNQRDEACKSRLVSIKPTVFCIHGNHEIRPANLPNYQLTEWHGGKVWYEEKYPRLLFAKDGDIFDLEGLRHLVIGGAYSVDKYYRLQRGYGWWEDEQPSPEIRAYVEHNIAEQKFDIVLSHTCPFKYEPREMFLPMVDQSLVDDSTEKWLDMIEESISYQAWFCGHWHTDKRIDRLHFLFKGFESAEQFISRGRKGSET